MTFDFSPWNAFLVFARTASLVSFFPMLADLRIPRTVRIGLSLWLSLAIFPTLPATSFQPTSLPQLASAILIEILIGALFGLLIRIVFAGFSMGLQWIDSDIGFQVAQQINPLAGTPSSPFGSLALVIAALIFWSCGFFENLIFIWARIFKILPPPVGMIPLRVGDTIVDISSHIFTSALEIAIPTVVIMFLVTFAIGLIARAVQGINIFFETFTSKILIGMGVLILLSPLIVAIMQKQLKEIPELWMMLLRALMPS
jgi:flagellar biosynthetic protein FliR